MMLKLRNASVGSTASSFARPCDVWSLSAVRDGPGLERGVVVAGDSGGQRDFVDRDL